MELEGYELVGRAIQLAIEARHQINSHPLISKYFRVATPAEMIPAVALGGRLEDLTANMGLLGPEVPDAKALNIPLDQAEILVTEKAVEFRALKEFRHEDFAGQLQLLKIERGGVPILVGLDTTLQRFDVLFVAGLKSAVDKVAGAMGSSSSASSPPPSRRSSPGIICSRSMRRS
jgi:putative transport protein